MAKYFDPNESELVEEYGEQTQLSVRRPAPQRSNLVNNIEDIIHSDAESTSSDALNETLMTTFLNATDAELREEFGEYDAREIRGLKIAEDKVKETRGRLISKIALLDEQVGQETDPEKNEKNTRSSG